jgi:hypothetical protein
MGSSSNLNNLIFRALQLKQLGNSNSAIRSTLSNLGASEKDIDQVMRSISSQKKKGNQRVEIFLIYAGICLFLLFLIGIIVAIKSSETNPAVVIAQTSEIPTKSPTRENTVTASPSLPETGEAYFAIIWNLEGSDSEKTEQLKKANPPAKLKESHQIIYDAYANYSKLDEAFNIIETKYQEECYTQTSLSNACKDMVREAVLAESERNVAYAELYNAWKTVCEDWKKYYTNNGVPFSGSCELP